MQKINIGIDFSALTRRQFLKVAAGGLAAAGGAVLPRPRAPRLHP